LIVRLGTEPGVSNSPDGWSFPCHRCAAPGGTTEADVVDGLRGRLVCGWLLVRRRDRHRTPGSRQLIVGELSFGSWSEVFGQDLVPELAVMLARAGPDPWAGAGALMRLADIRDRVDAVRLPGR
jgi:hypothetical protein